MREYGQVQSSFWQSKDFEGFSDSAKLLALYLLTGPHTNGIGCFRMTDGYVTDDLGWPTETVSKAFAELSANGFAYRFGKVVFLPNFLRWNTIANGNVAKARFKEFDALPKGEAKAAVARAMLTFYVFWAEAEKTVLETVSQTVTQTVCQPEPNPTQKEPREEEREKPTPLHLQPSPPAAPVKRATADPGVELQTWLDSLGGKDAIPADDPIFEYAENSGIPQDYLELSWRAFVRDMRERRTRKKDWRAHYRNAVRRNWFKLWWFDKDGVCQLTTSGVQERRNAA